MDDRIIINVELKGKSKEQFDYCFTSSGLTSRAEFIRYLINQEFKAAGGNHVCGSDS